MKPRCSRCRSFAVIDDGLAYHCLRCGLTSLWPAQRPEPIPRTDKPMPIGAADGGGPRPSVRPPSLHNATQWPEEAAT